MNIAASDTQEHNAAFKKTVKSLVCRHFCNHEGIIVTCGFTFTQVYYCG